MGNSQIRMQNDTAFDNVADSSPNSHEGEHNFQGKTGSGSLLSSSETDGWNGRFDAPWSTTANIGSPVQSRSQDQATSPVQRRYAERSTIAANLKASAPRTPTYFSVDPSSLSQSRSLSSQDSFRNSAGDQPQRSLNAYLSRGFSRRKIDEPKRQNVNSVNYGANRLAHSAQPTRLPFDLDSDDLSQKLVDHHSNGILAEAPNKAKLENAAPPRQSGSSIYPSLYKTSTSHASQRPFDQTRHSLYSGNHDHAVPFESQEDDQFATTFGRLDIQPEDTHNVTRPSFQRQERSQRQLYDSQAAVDASLSRPKFYTASEERNFGSAYTHAPDSVPEFSFHEPPSYYRTASFGERGSDSPNASEYRRSVNSPFYSASGTPPTGPESMRSTSGSGLSSRASNGHDPLLDRKLRGIPAYQPEQQYLPHNPLQGRMQYPPHYDFSVYPTSLRLNPLASPYAISPFPGMPSVSHTARYPSRDNDPGQILRSPLLEDFRTNHKTNKRYELKVCCLAAL